MKVRSFTSSLVWVIIAYIMAAAAAIGTGYFLWEEPQWLLILGADIAATVVIFAFSVALKNTSMYDAYWSIIPIWIVVYLWLFPEREVNDIRSLLAGSITILWGLRLTWNWLRGWPGLHHEDWRYIEQRKQTGKMFQFVNFFGLHMMPTGLVYLGCLTLIPALSTSNEPLNWIDIVATLVGLTGIFFETVADQQLRNFRKTNTDKSRILETGLWKFSRHPNYFGEVSFWYGLAWFSIAAAPADWWRLSGAVGMTALFLFISIPMIDKRMLEKRPHYAERMKRVSAIFPWPPKKG